MDMIVQNSKKLRYRRKPTMGEMGAFASCIYKKDKGVL